MANQDKTLRPIDKPHYKYWQALYLAFFSSKLYVDVAKRWKGLGLLYVFFVLAIATLPFSLRIIYEFKQELRLQYLEPIRQIPPLFIQNGRLSFDQAMPYFIKNNKGQVIGIIDNTGAIRTKTSNYPKLIALITEKQLTVWPPSGEDFAKALPSLAQLDMTANQGVGFSEAPPEPFTVDFPGDANEVLDLAALINGSDINKTITFVELLIYPCLLVLLSIMEFAFLLAYGFMGVLLANLFFKFKVSYAKACRLLAVASTPQIFIISLAFLFGLVFPGFGFILLSLSTLYYCYGLIALKRESGQLVL